MSEADDLRERLTAALREAHWKYDPEIAVLAPRQVKPVADAVLAFAAEERDRAQAALARVEALCDEATMHRDALPASTFGGGKFPALINARDVLAALSPAPQQDGSATA